MSEKEVSMKRGLKFLLCITACSIWFNYNGVSNVTNQVSQASNEAVYVSNFEGVVDLKTRAKSAFLMDYATNTVIYSHQPTTRLPIASMCKIMTLILSFEAIESKQLDMNDIDVEGDDK
jgi:D-alanyl-D-alanine carboxypeptidase (penicillin-binding protein 5/6)